MFTLKEYIYDFDKLLDEQDERSPGNTVHEIVHLSATVHTAVYLLVLFSEKGFFGFIPCNHESWRRKWWSVNFHPLPLSSKECVFSNYCWQYQQCRGKKVRIQRGWLTQSINPNISPDFSLIMLLTGHMAPDTEEALNLFAVHLTSQTDPGEWKSWFLCCRMLYSFLLDRRKNEWTHR